MLTNRESMKNILKIILKGYTIREKSWDGEKYCLDIIQAMTNAADGDEDVGYMSYLMSMNSNDIQEWAAIFGIGYDPEGNVIDLPESDPAKKDDYWSNWDVQNQTRVYTKK